MSVSKGIIAVVTKAIMLDTSKTNTGFWSVNM